MGCCHGKPTSQKNPKPDPSLKNPNRRRSPEPTTGNAPIGDRSPPPPPIEEETVKEVLSETPIPKPSCFRDNAKKRNEMKSDPTVEDEVKVHPTAAIKLGKKRYEMHRTVEDEVKMDPTAEIKPAEEVVSVVSEMSETVSYTFSESLSTATEKREDDGEVNQRVHRSPVKVPRRRNQNQISGHVPRGNERGVRSPARHSAPSPVKRNPVRPAQGSATTTATRRNVGPPGNRVRRDPGEVSGRRSRSPATRGEVGQRRPVRYRSPTVTVPSGRSGDRGPPATAEDDGERRAAKEEVAEEATESLENPMVSLECFIFV